MGTSAQVKAWIVLSEAYGENAVRGVKPSSISESAIRNASDVQDKMIDAFRADTRIDTFLSFKGIDSLLQAGFAAGAAIYKEHRDSAIAKSTLPSQDPVYKEWLEKPSMTRGLALRAIFESYPVDQEDGTLPPGFNSEAALKKINSDINSGSLMKHIFNNISPLKI